MIKKRQIGFRQRTVLRKLLAHGRVYSKAHREEHRGWVAWTHSETVKVLESLEKYGYVTYADEAWTLKEGFTELEIPK